MHHRKLRFTYHWVIFAIGFLMVLTSLGFASSTRGTYKTAILDDPSIEIDYFFYSFFDSIRFVSTALLNLFFGVLVSKFGPRKLATAGFISLSAACAVCSFGTAYWHFYVGAAFLGIGFSWTTTSIVAYVVERWFAGGKGTVMGVILAANGLGGAISEVIISPMALSENGLGWRFAYRLTAVLFFVMAVLVLSLLRARPEEKGLEPLWKDRKAKAKRGSDWEGYAFSLVRKKWFFYVSAVCVFVTGMVLQAMHGLAKTHIYSVLGRSDAVVVWITAVFTLQSLVLLASKIGVGIAFDRFGLRITFGACSIACVIALVTLAFLSPSSTVGVWLYSVTSALALPLETVVIPLLVSELFGRCDHARIMGYFLGFSVFGYAFGGPIADLFKQISSTYNGILIAFAMLMIACTVAMQVCITSAAKERKASQAQEKAV